jgi:hypothetical protein
VPDDIHKYKPHPRNSPKYFGFAKNPYPHPRAKPLPINNVAVNKSVENVTARWGENSPLIFFFRDPVQKPGGQQTTYHSNYCDGHHD